MVPNAVYAWGVFDTRPVRARKSPELSQVALNAASLGKTVMHPALPLDQTSQLSPSAVF